MIFLDLIAPLNRQEKTDRSMAGKPIILRLLSYRLSAAIKIDKLKEGSPSRFHNEDESLLNSYESCAKIALRLWNQRKTLPLRIRG